MQIRQEGNFLTDDEEINFLTDSKYLEEYPNLINTIDIPIYSVSDLNISPRDATYWDKQGILPTVKGPGMRRKFDLYQSIWIKLIQQMRSLGISLVTIKSLKDNLLEPKIDVSQYDPETLNKILNAIQAKYNASISAEQILNELKENGPSLFKSTVLAAIIYRKDIHCIVNKDGEYILYDVFKHQELLSKNNVFTEFISQPYFCLSIAKAYQTLIKEWSPQAYISNSSLLSKTEIEILDMIRRKDVKSISIRFKDGEPDLLEVEEQNTISIEQRFLDVIAKNGFQQIKIATRHGKIVNFENKIQKKLNKSTI